MTAAERGTIAAVHDYWFGALDDRGMPQPDRHRLWFGSDPATDRACAQHFGDVVEQAVAGALDHWADTDDGLVALIAKPALSIAFLSRDT